MSEAPKVRNPWKMAALLMLACGTTLIANVAVNDAKALAMAPMTVLLYVMIFLEGKR